MKVATKNTKCTKKTWPMVRLGDVCDEIRERIQSSKVDVAQYITTDNMIKGCGGVREAEVVPSDVTLVHYKVADVLISNIRPYLKKAWLADRDGGCSSDVIVFRNNRNDLSPEYLYRVLSQDGFFDYSMQNVSGTKMPRGKRDWIKRFEFPLPPLLVQLEIVARLEKELGEADALAAKFKEIAESADAEFKAELDETFKNVEGEKVRLGDVFDVVSARRVHKAEWKNSGVPFYRAREIVRLADVGFVNNELFISEELYQRYKASSGVPLPNDLMVSGVGTIGRVYVVKERDRFYYKDASVLCFKNINSINPYFAKYYIESPKFRSIIHAESMGTTVDTITMERANEYPFILLSHSKQSAIVAKLDSAKARCEKLKAAAERGMRAAEELRKAILAEAFEQ